MKTIQTNALNVSILRATDGIYTPDDSSIISWAQLAYKKNTISEVSIKVVDNSESQALNKQYRGKNQATNVLSFPMEADIELDIEILGDLALCAGVIQQEAFEQNKKLDAHWAHMVIHGMLHLQGYDHIEEDEARTMEQLEIELLNALGFADPYQLR